MKVWKLVDVQRAEGGSGCAKLAVGRGELQIRRCDNSDCESARLLTCGLLYIKRYRSFRRDCRVHLPPLIILTCSAVVVWEEM